MRSPFLHLIVWALVSSAALSGYGYWYAVIAHKSAAVAELQNRIDEKTEAASRIAAARATLAEIAGDEASVENYFVPETGVVPFIDDLEERAQALSASLKVVSVSAVPKQPIIVFSLAIEGSFDAIMRTMGAIEYAPYDLSVSKLSISENGKGLWHADLELSVGSVPAATSTRAALL
jgi:hypothetical protein